MPSPTGIVPVEPCSTQQIAAEPSHAQFYRAEPSAPQPSRLKPDPAETIPNESSRDNPGPNKPSPAHYSPAKPIPAFSHRPLTSQPVFSWRFAGFALQTPHSLSRYAGSRRFATRFFPQAQRGGFFFVVALRAPLFPRPMRGRIFRNDSRSRHPG